MIKIRVHELILYRNFSETIFSDMAYVANNYRNEHGDREALIDKLYSCINSIVTIAIQHFEPLEKKLSAKNWNTSLQNCRLFVM